MNRENRERKKRPINTMKYEKKSGVKRLVNLIFQDENDV
jgi:hypothetical protein